MNDEILLKWHTYRYFAYERDLARRELSALGISVHAETDKGIVVKRQSITRDKLSRLTYFSEIVGVNGIPIIPDQAQHESSVFFAVLGDDAGTRKQSKKQQTRYSAHGLHEYKGKFNPQIVRAIGNLLGVERGNFVIDPFCGSGTALVEASFLGWNALGLDVNPLAVLIANSKLLAVKTPPAQLLKITEKLQRRITRIVGLESKSSPSLREIEKVVGKGCLNLLPHVEYLRQWFPVAVLGQVAGALQAIDAIVPRKLRPIYYVLLSDVLRDVSWQNPDDLRIRRREDERSNYPAISLLLESMRSKIELVARTANVGITRTTRQTAVHGDSAVDLARIVESSSKKRVDFAITSPPYATALPYIDTQRLSLVLLNLVEPRNIMRTEQSLIGAREITARERVEWEKRLDENYDNIPRDLWRLCRRLLKAAGQNGNGFRRRNTPSLMYRYFTQMRHVFGNMSGLMRRGGKFALVVGQNATNLGGKDFLIDTPTHLCRVAEENNYRVIEDIRLDTYQRYGLHQKNAIKTEKLIILSRR